MNNQSRSIILIIETDEKRCDEYAQWLADEPEKVVVASSIENVVDMNGNGSPCMVIVGDDSIHPEPNPERYAHKLSPNLPAACIADEHFIAGSMNDPRFEAWDFVADPPSPIDLRSAARSMRRADRTTDRLELAEARFDRFIRDLPVMFLRVNEDFALESINRACAGITGFTPEEALHSPEWISARLHNEDESTVRKALAEALFRGNVATVHCRLRHKLGYVVHGLLKVMPAPTKEGIQANSLDCIFLDITDQVYRDNMTMGDEKLKMLGMVSSEMAHELRNPLMSIGGFARRLAGKAPGYPETDIILKESKRMERYLDKISGYLNPLGRITCSCSIADVLDAALKERNEDLEQRGIDVALLGHADRTSVDAAPDVLRKVFATLIKNASQAIVKGGALTIRIGCNDGSADVSFVTKLGELRGVDPDQVFMPADEDGYGLPLCFRVCNRMGGRLSLRREDDQAVFTVSLPQSSS